MVLIVSFYFSKDFLYCKMGIMSAICYLTKKKGERKNKLVTAVSGLAELQQHLSRRSFLCFFRKKLNKPDFPYSVKTWVYPCVKEKGRGRK